MKKLLCPTCRQDMNEPPRKGLLGRDCPQCGQGIMWRFARRVEEGASRRGKGSGKSKLSRLRR